MVRRRVRPTLFPYTTLFRSGSILLLFERPLLDRAVHLAQVVDAGVHLRGGARLDEVGEGGRSTRVDASHITHTYDERCTRIAGGSVLHTVFCLSILRLELSD